MDISRIFSVTSTLLIAFFLPMRASALQVLMVGDSITFGVISNATLDPYNGDSYAELLAQSLGVENVVNVSCGGSLGGSWHPFAGPTPTCGPLPGSGTLNLFAQRISPNVPVDIGTVLLGTNDAILGVSIANYRTNIEILADALLYVGAGRVILLTPPPIPEVVVRDYIRVGTPAITARLLAYRLEVLDICATTPEVSCIDVYTLLAANMQDYFYDNQLHPNEAAHALIHEHVLAHVIPEPSSGILLLLGLLGLYVFKQMSTNPRVLFASGGLNFL